MHKVETWNRASAAEVDGIACCIFSESAHTTSAREHTTRNVGVRPRMWTACIAHVFDMLTFVSHLPSSIIYPGAESPQNIEVRVFPKYNWVVYSTTRAMRRADHLQTWWEGLVGAQVVAVQRVHEQGRSLLIPCASM